MPYFARFTRDSNSPRPLWITPEAIAYIGIMPPGINGYPNRVYLSLMSGDQVIIREGIRQVASALGLDGNFDWEPPPGQQVGDPPPEGSLP